MISVHMTTYCRFKNNLLPKAVNSVLTQNFDDFEFVIYDDCSYDGTQEYLEGLKYSDHRVKLIRGEKNVNSVAISLGNCLKNTDPRRRFITWMFDDCELRPNALEQLVNSATRSNLAFVFGIGLVHLRTGETFPVGHRSIDFIKSNVQNSSVLVPNAGILCKREIFDRIGWYDSSVILRRSCDWDLFNRMFRNNLPFAKIDEVLADEYGDLQPDSLRNSFTTTFDIMKKFTQLRDENGWNLSLDSCLYQPVDRIPPGPWTEEELSLMYYMFLEYFLSVGNLAKAFLWAERLNSRLDAKPFFLDNLYRSAKNGKPDPMAVGAYAGAVFAAYREEQNNRQLERNIGYRAYQKLQRRPFLFKVAKTGWRMVRELKGRFS
jgi:glycosyltransferase involved in cell wall biosynthesis